MNVRQLRENANLCVLDVACSMGVTDDHVFDLESGEADIGIEELGSYCAACGVDYNNPVTAAILLSDKPD